MQVVFASAPPSVGNMAVGFDILGHALDASGDQVKVLRTSAKGVRMGSVTGVVKSLPSDPLKNTAGLAVHLLLKEQHADFGVEIHLHKGIALGSGMGGSAASAVAAALAANEFLPQPLARQQLLAYALAGEAVASGSIHGDNVAPCLLGGIVYVPPSRPAASVKVPVPNDLYCVLVRPELRLDTAHGRSLLSPSCPLKDVVTQSSHLAALLCACYENNIDALRGVLNDLLIEPQRAPQIEGYYAIKQAALDAGALGFSISGSGPSMIAWCHRRDCDVLSETMRVEVARYHQDYQIVVSTVNAPGACIISEDQWHGA